MATRRILGTLRSSADKGIVHMEDRVDAHIDDLWSALTDPARLAHWLGEVEGDLRVGGEFRAHFFASGWEGTGRIEACVPPEHLLVLTTHTRQTGEHAIEVTLAAEGARTVLVWEERGMPLDQVAAYGTGIQIHVEDLEEYVAGCERRDAGARFEDLLPSYELLATTVRSQGAHEG